MNDRSTCFDDAIFQTQREQRQRRGLLRDRPARFAAELSGNRPQAREYYRQLLTLAGGSDAANRAELRQARAFLSQP